MTNQNVTERAHGLLLTAALASSILACDSSVLIGSMCKDGVCPFAEGADTCVVRTTERGLQIAPATDSQVSGVCLPAALRRDAHGLSTVHVYWILSPGDAVTQCDQKPFLHPVSAFVAKSWPLIGPDAVVCEVEQLPVLVVSDARPDVPSGSGFYYDDFSVERVARCPTLQPQRIVFSADAQPVARAHIRVREQELLDRGGDATSAAVCSAAFDEAHVGDSCVPPLEDYAITQAVLATRSAACGGGTCLAYHALGSIAQDCDASVATCVSEEARALRMSCTCRCDAPEPDAELCACPSGLVCVPIATDGPLAGSYCVPDSIVHL
jgi:hypothetical protein